MAVINFRYLIVTVAPCFVVVLIALSRVMLQHRLILHSISMLLTDVF